MKLRSIFCLLACFSFLGCEKDSTPAIEFSQTDFHDVPYEETTISLELRTDLEWTATSMVSWCTVSQNKGSGSTALNIKVEGNIYEERSGIINIWTPNGITKISIHQNAMPAGQEYHYKIPVVFHVLYNDPNDNKQYVPQTRLAEILKKVNAYYRGETLYHGGNAGVDMNLEFVLADKDEKGNTLSAPGVEYVKIDNMPLDCEKFMSAKKNVDLLWDPNRYINIMLYNFDTVDGGNSIILGISHLPLSVSGSNYLVGLPQTPYSYLTKENLSYPKCVSINSLYVYEETGNDGRYNSLDVNVTLAHELGHHLGLHHAFDENDDASLTDKCIDTDYCKDTPSYNRMAYLANLRAMLQEAQQTGKEISMAEATTRENCKTGETFKSYNLMDYEICYSDRFTNDQRNRIRHVLTYSPLTPGPKKTTADTRNVISGPLDLPMVIVK
ncbi:zinc-dependent metalloproteinase lipoprotein [Bacteroides cutis]|uniref:zinc-dependent metalloproteinase lipoprotein n=1 Tax=Bacteroides cutis TaxID=2024197 RepID=UPI0015E0C02A|nr:zinc-dependent metalloproteinase lipoprotein [Bacteroides cutis]